MTSQRADGNAVNAQITTSREENNASDAKKKETTLISEESLLTWKCQRRRDLPRKQLKPLRTKTKSNIKRERPQNVMIKTSLATPDQETGHVLDAKTSIIHSETPATNVAYCCKNTPTILPTLPLTQSTGPKSSQWLS